MDIMNAYCYAKIDTIVNIYAGIEPRNYEKAKSIMLEQFEIMRKGEFSDVQFQASVDTLVASLKSIYDSKEEFARTMFANQMFFGKDVTIEEIIEKVKCVKKEDVLRIASKVYTDSIFCLGGEVHV